MKDRDVNKDLLVRQKDLRNKGWTKDQLISYAKGFRHPKFERLKRRRK